MMNVIVEVCKEFGLAVFEKQTETMCIPARGEQTSEFVFLRGAAGYNSVLVLQTLNEGPLQPTQRPTRFQIQMLEA